MTANEITDETDNGIGNSPGLSCSKSYLNVCTGAGNWERHDESRDAGGTALRNEAPRTCGTTLDESQRPDTRCGKNVSVGRESRTNTPSRTGRRRSSSEPERHGQRKPDTPQRKEKPSSTATPSLKPILRKGSRFPEIDKKYMSLYPDMKQFNPREIEMPDGAHHVQKTTSSVSFTLFFKPPTKLPPIRRHHSDDVGEKQSHTATSPAKTKRYKPTSSRKVKVCRNAMDTIRQDVEGLRQEREHKNLQVTRAKLEHLEQHAASLGRPTLSESVQNVRDTQDKIREESFHKSMMNFVINKQKSKQTKSINQNNFKK